MPRLDFDPQRTRRALTLVALLAAAPAVQAQTLFADDFSDARRGWPVSDPRRPARGGLFTYLSSGSYQITPLQKGGYALATAPLGGYGPDVAVDAEVFLAGTSPASGAGVACRVSDSTSYYAFVLAPSQRYAVLLSRGGRSEVLRSGSFAFDPHRNQRLRAECEGDRLAFSANGRLLAEVRDTTLSGGHAGLFVTALDAGAASGAFDSFSLTQLGRRATALAPARRGVSAPPPAAEPGARGAETPPGLNLRPDEALVVVDFLTFRYEGTLAWRAGGLRVVRERTVTPLRQYQVLINPGDGSYGVVLKADSGYTNGVAGWDVAIEPDGRGRCVRSPLFAGGSGRMQVWNAAGQLVCSL